MDNFMQDFIKDNLDLIEKCRWKELFNNMSRKTPISEGYKNHLKLMHILLSSIIRR